MKEIATIRFEDADSGMEALAVIRAAENLIAIGLSLVSNGDLEVFLQPQDCRRLIAALEQATKIADK